MLSEAASWRSETLGPARRLQLGAAVVRAHRTGEGPAIVFVHGALVNANLWRKVVPRLDGFTRVALDLPLGSHIEPVPGADLTPPALADLIAGAIETLELKDVTLVANDTGGALSQILVTRRPERIGRLVLTSCDAFDNFPPRAFRIALAPARIPGALPWVMKPLRVRRLRRLPLAYGWLTREPIAREADDSYMLPVIEDRHIGGDVRRLLAGLDTRHPLDAAARLPGFDRPVLIAWSADDRFFPPAHGERLARILPDARLEPIEGARTFSAEDRPERLAELIGSFASRPAEQAA